MKKIARAFFAATLVLLILGMTACGGAKPENWPTDKFVRGVPAPQHGTVEKSTVSKDVDGKEYAIIKMVDFTADNMSVYINHILDSGWETNIPQSNDAGIISYSARNKDRSKYMYLICNTSENTLSIEIQQ